MAEKRMNAGTVAVCRAAESSYDSAATLTHLLPTRGLAGVTTAADNYDSSVEANGVEESTLLLPTQNLTTLDFSDVPAYDLNMIFLLSHALGSTGTGSSAGATSKRFQWSPNAIGTSLKSETLQVNHSDLSTTGEVYQNTKYTGCVVDNYSLSGSVSSKTWTQSVRYVASGTTAAGGDISSLTGPNYGPFLFNNTYCYVGSAITTGSARTPQSGNAPDGSEVSNAVSLTPYLLGVNYNVTNNIDIEGSHQGSLGTLATTLPERAQRKQTVSLELKWDPTVSLIKQLRSLTIPTSQQSYSAANSTSLAVQCFSNVPIDGSGTVYCYAFALYFPLVWLDSVRMGLRNNKRTITANFVVGAPTSSYYSNIAMWIPGSTAAYGG